MKVAIVGANAGYERTKPSIGFYHALRTAELGHQVVAVSNSSYESAHYSIQNLKKNGINATPYCGLETMLSSESPDAVIIASPPGFHLHHIKKSLSYGYNVMVEKPMIYSRECSCADNLYNAYSIFDMASERNLVLAVNLQLSYFFDAYLEWRAKSAANATNAKFTVEIKTSGEGSGLEIPEDLLPHALGLAFRIDRDSYISLGHQSAFSHRISDKKTEIEFDIETRSAIMPVHFVFEKNSQNTSIKFGFDDYVVERQMVHGDSVAYNLLHEGISITPHPLKDPLEVSLGKFFASIDLIKNGNPRNMENLLVTQNQAQKINRAYFQIMEILRGNA